MCDIVWKGYIKIFISGHKQINVEELKRRAVGYITVHRTTSYNAELNVRMEVALRVMKT